MHKLGLNKHKQIADINYYIYIFIYLFLAGKLLEKVFFFWCLWEFFD